MSRAPEGINRRVMKHPLGWIAAGFGSGFSPRAPGTAGSIAALLPWWFLMQGLSPLAYLAVLALGFALGCWAAQWVIRETRVEDPGLVVWDEFIGVWIALFAAPAGWPWMLAGLVLFRIFDIAKPWPVSWADRKLHGGFGTMLDDALAGLYALGSLQLVAYFF